MKINNNNQKFLKDIDTKITEIKSSFKNEKTYDCTQCNNRIKRYELNKYNSCPYCANTIYQNKITNLKKFKIFNNHTLIEIEKIFENIIPKYWNLEDIEMNSITEYDKENNFQKLKNWNEKDFIINKYKVKSEKDILKIMQILLNEKNLKKEFKKSIKKNYLLKKYKDKQIEIIVRIRNNKNSLIMENNFQGYKQRFTTGKLEKVLINENLYIWKENKENIYQLPCNMIRIPKGYHFKKNDNSQVKNVAGQTIIIWGVENE